MLANQSQITAGSPSPLGTSTTPTGWNFAVFSPKSVVSLVIAPLDNPKNMQKIALHASANRTGDIWHVAIETKENAFFYGYEVEGVLLVDPYAKFLATNNQFGNNSWANSATQLLAIAAKPLPFDWEGDTPLGQAIQDVIAYEMHIRGFTQHASSGVSKRGTYAGVIEKIPYLRDLGITAVELMPVHEFDESEYVRTNPITQEKLYNYWGYSPLNFFCPMLRYASSPNPLEAHNEFKAMVKALHKAGIEVILDIVLNHTGEGNEWGRTLSWKGFAEGDYYTLDQFNKHMNFSGCGNTLQCNFPLVQDLLVESLRYFVTEFHVDGFRFDLASVLYRGREGKPLDEPPLIDRITHDPLLKNIKLIAEPWDAAGLHQVGTFYQIGSVTSGRWIEWNDSYRIVTRQFMRGDKNKVGSFATRLCGSEDIYGKGGMPQNSLNYITCHDGFTLCDLVSYNEKHNLANGENNHDGANFNDSWNCGQEGPTAERTIETLRQRQMRNFLLALLVSQGVPMLQMGDEYGHTKHGNNNSWCQDNDTSWFLWDRLKENQALFYFAKELIWFRKSHPLLCRKSFLTKADIDWHGIKPFAPDWSESSQLIACTLKDSQKTKNDLYFAFNSSSRAIEIELPPSPEGHMWTWIANSASSPPSDFVSPTKRQEVHEQNFILEAHSSILLLQQTK